MHDRDPIRARHAAGEPIKAIARDLGISRNTVRAALDPERATTYRRRSPLDDLEPAILDVLARWPLMPAYGVAYRVGYTGSLSALRARLRHLRHRPRDHTAPAVPSQPMSTDQNPCRLCGSPVRLARRPGEATLEDAGPPAPIYVRVCTNRDCETNGPERSLDATP